MEVARGLISECDTPDDLPPCQPPAVPTDLMSPEAQCTPPAARFFYEGEEMTSIVRAHKYK